MILLQLICSTMHSSMWKTRVTDPLSSPKQVCRAAQGFRVPLSQTTIALKELHTGLAITLASGTLAPDARR